MNVSIPVDMQGTLLWTTKDGRRIPVEGMSSGHLRNAHAYVRRWHDDTSDPLRRQMLAHAIGVFEAEMARRGWDRLALEPAAEDAIEVK